MSIRLKISAILIVIVAGPAFLTVSPGEASDIYPSDAELYEAYRNGEIDYQTYLNLLEIFENGVDSTELYLLEEIPNISYFQRTWPEIFSRVETEQKEPFMAPVVKPKLRRISGYFKVHNTLKLEENGPGRSYYYLKSKMPGGWSTNLKLSRGYDGTYEWSRRSLSYRIRRGTIRKIMFGNFNARFGLGLSVGYRGALLSKDDSFANETILFPDYGGYNGIYIESGRRHDGVKVIGHFDKNSTHRFRMAAVDIMKKYGGLRWEGIVLGGILENRATGREFRYYQLGTFLNYVYGDYEAAIEVAFPQYASSVVPAVIFESSYADYPIRLRLSGWHYADDYLNLTGGARSGSHSRQIEIDSLDFEYRDRRNNQRGILLRAESNLTRTVLHDISLSLYGNSRFEHFSRMVTGLEYNPDDVSTIRLEYGYKKNKLDEERLTDNEIRTEYRFKNHKFNWRSHIGYSEDKYDRRYLSVFSGFRVKHSGIGEAEIWCNFDKINVTDGGIDYLYMYVREKLAVMEFFDMMVKYSYRYSISGKESKLYLEAKMQW